LGGTFCQEQILIWHLSLRCRQNKIQFSSAARGAKVARHVWKISKRPRFDCILAFLLLVKIEYAKLVFIEAAAATVFVLLRVAV